VDDVFARCGIRGGNESNLHRIFSKLAVSAGRAAIWAQSAGPFPPLTKRPADGQGGAASTPLKMDGFNDR
jgi:hypothetical protein